MKIKAAQLDLARQKENLPFIFSFIDFIKKNKFNTLVLYLEGIVKTPTLPWVASDIGYESNEMKEVVKYAKKAKIDVIPVVSCLGHMETFFQHSQLRPLAELDGDIEGRWITNHLDQICPSRKESYDFLQGYLSEISELFPSKYFHAGLDESFQIGMCPACKNRMAQIGAEGLYADHVKEIHKILSACGKTMMMWHDMFEIYPKALQLIPRDIILCAWYYDYFSDKLRSHFLNQLNEDAFREYDRMGFQYLFCTGSSIPNIESFTRYANRYHPLGGLVTMWEKSNTFYHTCYPGLTFAGTLWNASKQNKVDYQTSVTNVIHKLTTIKDSCVLSVLDALLHQNPYGIYSLPSTGIWGEIHPAEEEKYRNLEAFDKVLSDANSDRNSVLTDMRIGLGEANLSYKIRKFLYHSVMHTIHGDGVVEDATSLLREKKSLLAERNEQWKTFRNGISNNHLKTSFAHFQTTFQERLTQIKHADYFLFLNLFLPDFLGVPWLTVSIQDETKKSICILNCETLKPPISDQRFYEYIIPFRFKKRPMSVLIEASGYGGQGLTFLKIIAPNGITFTPSSILASSGQVVDPSHILMDDLRWCYLGEKDSRRGFLNNCFAKMTHKFEVAL